jgi:hypothetical protein
MNEEAFIAVGNYDQLMKVIMIGFKEPSSISQTYVSILSLRALGSIDAAVEPFRGLYNQGVTANGFHILMMYMPVSLDAYDIGDLVVAKVKEQLGIELVGYDLTLIQQLQYAEVYRYRQQNR